MSPTVLESPVKTRMEKVYNGVDRRFLGEVEVQFLDARQVPGGPPGQKEIILVKPLPGRQPGQLFMLEHEQTGAEFMRSWFTVRHFAGSEKLPDGVDIGYIANYTDTGLGQPYVEKTECQVDPDTMLRIERWARGQTYMGMHERRRLGKESEQYAAEHKAGLVKRPETMTPEAVMQGIGEDRIAALVEQRSRQILDEYIKATSGIKTESGKETKAK